MFDLESVASAFQGTFYTPPAEIAARLQKIRAFIFDWDGVFNNGVKDSEGASPFNEVDAMGTNLLRFNHYLRNGDVPVTMVISGERNPAAFRLAEREHFHAVYCGIKYKAVALDHLQKAYGIADDEVAFFFDDVLDFSVSARAGLRIMIGRACNPLMIRWAAAKGYIDYCTAADGTNYGLREGMELLKGLSGRFEDTMSERAMFTSNYTDYLAARNIAKPQYFTVKDSTIIDL
jgi:3-deoxy-D-manno-octulosonate 8-phosphate phosphatase (KDO 8-P phosphatase)